jgi:hypothetical protein
MKVSQVAYIQVQEIFPLTEAPADLIVNREE